jgi:hypothetical protein
MDGKGVWILHKPLPIPDQKDQVSHRGTIEVQSYMDDVPRGNLMCRPSDINEEPNAAR